MRDHASMLLQPVHQLRQRVDELKATLSNHNSKSLIELQSTVSI